MTKHIKDVTLVMLGGSYTKLVEAALYDIHKQFSFNQILAFSDQPLDMSSYHVDNIVTPMRSVEDATWIAWREVLPRITTNHILSCHWDGFPVNVDMWMEYYKDFDFIGAVWPWFTTYAVGNTGFSLQSKKLLIALSQMEPRQPEDMTICRTYRPLLENEWNIKFAPEEIADAFSIEHGPDQLSSFGFHGLWNMLYFMDDETLKQRLTLLTPIQWQRPDIQMLMVRALVADRRNLYRWLHSTFEQMTEKKNASIFAG